MEPKVITYHSLKHEVLKMSPNEALLGYSLRPQGIPISPGNRELSIESLRALSCVEVGGVNY